MEFRPDAKAPLTRRSLLGLMALPVGCLYGQEIPSRERGMATRSVRAAPRGKPSGLPFHGRFTDVARQAGLKEVVVAGHPDRVDYVIEAMSCGVAFFDYDNDGWLDILVLSGSRFGDPPPAASNRLYKNNRDGTFTDVTRKAGLFRTGYANGVTVADYNNDGFDDIFITYWGQNVLYRNNGDGTFTDVTKAAGLLKRHAALRLGLHISGLRSRWQAGSVRLELRYLRHQVGASRQRIRAIAIPGRLLRAARSCRTAIILFTAITATARSRM